MVIRAWRMSPTGRICKVSRMSLEEPPESQAGTSRVTLAPWRIRVMVRLRDAVPPARMTIWGLAGPFSDRSLFMPAGFAMELSLAKGGGFRLHSVIFLKYVETAGQPVIKGLGNRFNGRRSWPNRQKNPFTRR